MAEYQLDADPYAQGGDCFINGGVHSENPYPVDSAEFARWVRGFYAAAAESADAHSCETNSEWSGAEKFCTVCGRKTDELE
ncbi:hypothetical protein GL273_20700 [Aeromonas jandaei]|uniref:hypothetical protein n=1 Tax=Aeromonas jandaei TaxID=650 RepID=UPI001C5AD70F|nr:hypothetical protein [Aeromonas jandaei]MBW3808180.1 hypothetical protein [Aeromonas jandaei]